MHVAQRRESSVQGRLLGGGEPALDGTGLAKLWVVSHALRARREHPELFTGYTPLLLDGPAQEHLVAFDRGGAITLATRLPAGLSADRLPLGLQLIGRPFEEDTLFSLAEVIARSAPAAAAPTDWWSTTAPDTSR